MLPKLNRLPAQDIPYVLRGGIHIRDAFFEFVYKKTGTVPRFSVIVSTKIDKRATARNRMKRLVREAVQQCIPSIKHGMDGVFIIKKKFPKDYSYEDVSLVVHSMV